MMTKLFTPEQLRIYFLYLLALCISLLLFRLINDFLLALLMAGIFAGLSHPLYTRILTWFKGREGVASAVTVLLILTLIIVPMLIFASILVNQTLEMSDTASTWIQHVAAEQETVQDKLQEVPALKQLLPYQDRIISKAGELVSRGSVFVAGALATGAKSTASFLMSLFIMLVAIFYFLPKGGDWLDKALRYTPLSENDKEQLLKTFISVTRASLKGTLIIGIVQGGLAGFSFGLAGISSPLFWASVMVVFSMLPVVGISVIWIPAVIFLALKGQTMAAVGVGLWCAIVAGTIDNLLRPILIGKDTKMPDLLVLITTLGGLAMLGAVGILIGPIIGALFVAVWEIWAAAVDESRKQQADTKPT